MFDNNPATGPFKIFSEEEYDLLKNEDDYVFCAILLPNKKWMTFCAKWSFRSVENGIWYTIGNRKITHLSKAAKEGWLVLIAKINLPEIHDEF